jgi:two-component system osmolarity sensor histidine kinase EnvZ
MAREKLNLQMSVLPARRFAAGAAQAIFRFLDRELSRQISQQVNRPYWIDTVGQSHLVEIRVKHDDAILRFVARRSQTYASNSEIFLVWMVGSSVIL